MNYTLLLWPHANARYQQETRRLALAELRLMLDRTAPGAEASIDEAAPMPSCRNADSACHEGQYVLTVDGFLASPNVTALESGVVDTGFRYSDYNPVYLEFVLEP